MEQPSPNSKIRVPCIVRNTCWVVLRPCDLPLLKLRKLRARDAGTRESVGQFAFHFFLFMYSALYCTQKSSPCEQHKWRTLAGGRACEARFQIIWIKAWN